MRRRSVIRDTIQMTVIQFFLECLALLFNAWMTRRVGAATVGTLALAGSFFNLAAMVAGGNAMLCASRFVSEELGKSCGCPAQILRNAVRFCLLLSVPVSAGIFAFAEPLSRQFLQSTAMAQAVRLMALLLPLGSISACLKGYFNAVCRVTVTAGCDVAEFLLRAGLLTGLLLWHRAAKPEQVCTYLVGSMAAGTLVFHGGATAFVCAETGAMPWKMQPFLWNVHSPGSAGGVWRLSDGGAQYGK